MYRYKKKKGKKKERSTKTSLNSLARNARTFRKLSLSVRRICRSFFCITVSYTIKCNSLKIKIEVHVNLW